VHGELLIMQLNELKSQRRKRQEANFYLKGLKWRAGLLRDSVMHCPALLGKMGNGCSANFFKKQKVSDCLAN